MQRISKIPGRTPLRALALAALLLAAGCGGFGGEAQYPEKRGGRVDPAPSGSKEGTTIFGEGGFSLFGGGGGDSQAGIGVNAYLWRASLDTIAFMPLASADPFGGVIITDWYTNPKQDTERFKMTIYILDKRLRADAVKVSVFRQEKTADGSWADAPSNTETGVRVENAILTRARQLRIDSEAG